MAIARFDNKASAAREIEHVVETSERSVRRAKIVRDGMPVADVQVDKTAIEGVLAGTREVVTRVVAQSIKAGTPVARGTMVNLTLTESKRIPGRAIEGIHVQFAEENLQDIFDKYLEPDPELQNIIARSSGGQALTAAERNRLSEKVRAKGVQVDEAAGTDVEAVIVGLQAGYTYGKIS